MLLIKLGGSIITNKKRPLSPRRKATDNISRALKKISEPFIIVHGGGSFGHYWSVKYNMHTRPARHGAKAVATVRDSMAELNCMVAGSLLKNGLYPYVLPPAGFVRADRPVARGIADMEKIAKSGMVPVTHGDAVWYGQNKYYILSGDRIMGMLARALRPRLCMFVLDIDGVYSDPKTKRLIPELKGHRPEIAGVPMDVTGGMQRKINEARGIARAGLDVFFVNGNRPERILEACRGKKFTGTIFRGGRSWRKSL